MADAAVATGQEEDVLYEVADHIATLTINRPDRMNTISGPMLDRLVDVLLQADRDPEVRCIVLTGRGKAFCAGLDLANAGSLGGSRASVGGSLDLRDTPPTVLHNIDTPIIAAINGGAAGYGLDTALGCDMRIAAESAKLAPAFCKRGLLPESGGTWFLPRLLGWAKASEIIFTGRTLSAQDSLELGLVNKVVPLDDLMNEAMAMAKEVAANAPLAVAAAKRMMRMGMNETFNDHVHHVYLQLLPLMRSDDLKEGMTAFMEKREPNFKGK